MARYTNTHVRPNKSIQPHMPRSRCCGVLITWCPVVRFQRSKSPPRRLKKNPMHLELCIRDRLRTAYGWSQADWADHCAFLAFPSSRKDRLASLRGLRRSIPHQLTSGRSWACRCVEGEPFGWMVVQGMVCISNGLGLPGTYG